jgi:hypothetical protein
MHYVELKLNMQYEPINFWGTSLVTTEGVIWKCCRAIANPAFSEVSSPLKPSIYVSDL